MVKFPRFFTTHGEAMRNIACHMTRLFCMLPTSNIFTGMCDDMTGQIRLPLDTEIHINSGIQQSYFVLGWICSTNVSISPLTMSCFEGNTAVILFEGFGVCRVI